MNAVNRLLTMGMEVKLQQLIIRRADLQITLEVNLNTRASIDYFGGARGVIRLKGLALGILNGFRRDDI